MATTVVAFIGTKAVDAESTTGWNTGNLDNDIFVEGSGSIGTKVSNATQDFYDTSIVGGPYDFSSGGGAEGDHIFGYFNTLTPVTLHAIIAGNGTDFGYWSVGPATGYGGGWTNYVIDPAADFSAIISGAWSTTGNPTQLDDVSAFGGRHTTATTIMGNFNNALVDVTSVGTGYRIDRGDGASADATFADIGTYEANSSNRYGGLVVQKGSPLPMLSSIQIGDETNNEDTDFTDSGFTVEWIDAPVAATFYNLTMTEAGGGTTNVTLSNGTLRAQSSSQTGLPAFDFSGVTAVSATNVNLIGGRLITLDSACTFTGGLWQDCGQITPGASSNVSGVLILDPTDDGALLVTGADQLDDWSGITFDGAGIGGTSTDAAIEIDTTGAGPFTIDLSNFKFNNRVSGSVDLHFLANGNADYTVNILAGGDTPTYTNDGSGSVTIVNSKDYDMVGMNDGTELTILDRSVSMIDVDGTGSAFAFGNAAATERAGQSFTVNGSGKAERIKLWLRKVGTPADGLTVRLVNGAPGSTLLAESLLIPGSTLTTSFVEYDIDLTEKHLLSFPTTYGVEIQRAGAIDSGNYYEIQYDTSDIHSPGDRYVYNSGWGTASGDLFFEIMEAASDNELFHVESSSGIETYTHGGVVKEIEVLAVHIDYKPIVVVDTLATTDTNVTLTQSPDRTYSNP